MTLSPTLRTTAERWLADDPDPVTAAELRGLLGRCAAGESVAIADVTERFTGQLEFGTAGLRGVLGCGPQRMNQVLVRQVTAGLGHYLLANVPDAARRGIVIGHDARHGSRTFAEDAARIFAGLGVRVWLAHRPWPTPTTAWLCGERGAAAGIMVTASHNPPEYNGYKVYWGNAAQIIPPIDVGIAAAIDQVTSIAGLAMPTLDEARASGLVNDFTEADHDAYLTEVLALRAQPALDPSNLVIAFTPLHGVGAASVEPALRLAGYRHVHTEPSQREPDATFPTVAFPNPEERGAMDRVLALASAVKADLVLANDPDADRLAVAVPTGAGPAAGAYRQLTGDQVGALLADYLLRHDPQGRTGKRLVACSLVSSQLLGYLAAAHGAEARETLTGFKWIANTALDWQAATGGRFVLGYEEALGYSVGELVRDKDGVSAALLFAELAVWCKANDRSVLDYLDDIYRRVGLFLTEQVSLTLPGAEGLAQIQAAMTSFRAAPPVAFVGHVVEQTVDLARGEGGLPPSDVLVYRLTGGRRIIMRPSGTEPKLKSYYEVRVEVGADEPMHAARLRGVAELTALRDAHQAVLRGCTG